MKIQIQDPLSEQVRFLAFFSARGPSGDYGLSEARQILLNCRYFSRCDTIEGILSKSFPPLLSCKLGEQLKNVEVWQSEKKNSTTRPSNFRSNQEKEQITKEEQVSWFLKS